MTAVGGLARLKFRRGGSVQKYAAGFAAAGSSCTDAKKKINSCKELKLTSNFSKHPACFSRGGGLTLSAIHEGLFGGQNKVPVRTQGFTAGVFRTV